MNIADFQNPWTDKDVEQHWDRVAHVYVEENNRVQDAHNQRFTRALELLDISAAHRVLNISSRDCGLLPFIDVLCKRVDVLNAEISQGLIDCASRAHPEARQMKLEGYSSLSLPAGRFDRVLSFETLEHVANPVAFLAELLRITLPGGRLVLSCPPATSEIAYRLYTVLAGGHGEGPHRFPSSREVKQWLKVAGWKLVKHEGTLLIPVGPKILRALGERIIARCQNTFVAELGIRQFYVCRKQP